MTTLHDQDRTDQRPPGESVRLRMAAPDQAEAPRNAFLAMLAHELRNPLAAISNAVAVSALQHTKEELESSLRFIGQQVGQLSRLIDDLLDISRITYNKVRSRKKIIDPIPVLRQAVEAARPFVQARNHELTLAFASGELRLDADPIRLEQVVLNLLINAAKYTPSGGHIRLDAGVEGGDVVIRVGDDGVGISPEMLARIFDLFTQEDQSLAHSEGGLGIGLSLVRSLVEMQGGTVSATSAGHGRGSEFVVRLPAAEGTTAAGGPEQFPTKTPARGVRILVVDDSANTAIGMAGLLKRVGHDVRVAHNGRAAIESASAQRPEVILLDIGLPDMDGYEVAEKLRLEEYGREATLIAIHNEDPVLERVKEAGFDHHLVKPVDLDALLSLLHRSDGVN